MDDNKNSNRDRFNDMSGKIRDRIQDTYENAVDSNAGMALEIAFKVAKAVTSPVWWPTKKAVQLGVWGAKECESTSMKVLVPTFAAAALTGYMGALAYAGAYARVAANDATSFLNWPATQGHLTGKVTRFSEKGTWPCNSFEGNLRTGEAADSEFFAVRKFNTEIIEALHNVPHGADVTLVYRDNGLSQEDFGQVIRNADGEFQRAEPNGLIGCIQHSDHTAVGVHYTDPVTKQQFSVGVKP